jgi:hypothetical protein
MAGELIALADEVAAALVAATLSSPLTTVTRTYSPKRRLEDLEDLDVAVVPQTTIRERAGRKAWLLKGKVVVGVQQRLASATKQAEADALGSLADEICEYLQSFPFTTGDLIELDEQPTWHPERYDKDDVFTRAILLTFQLRSLQYG